MYPVPKPSEKQFVATECHLYVDDTQLNILLSDSGNLNR